MGRKNRAKKKDDPGQGQDFQVNPFAQLAELVPKASLPDPQAPKPKPPPPAQPKTTLDREDQKLLRAFGEQSVQFDSSQPVSSGPAVTLSIQRKGKGGKTVTRIHGLGGLDLVARMQLAKELGQALGTNARFPEDAMEMQGDQRERAAEWLAQKGFRPRLA